MKKVLTTMIVGSRLAEYREKAGLTQDQLGEKLGYSRTTIVNWEAKASFKVDNEVLKKIETLLKVTSKDLTDVPHGTIEGSDILDNPVVKSLAKQSDYILQRVTDLEMENKELRKRLGE
jgi:transcriptional regulator with XRE-family HTH domain